MKTQEQILQEFDVEFQNTPSVNLDITTINTETLEETVYRDRLKQFITSIYTDLIEELEETKESIDSLPDMIHPKSHDDWVKAWGMALKRVDDIISKLK